MSNKRNNIKLGYLSFILLILSLTSCGGGDKQENNEPEAPLNNSVTVITHIPAENAENVDISSSVIINLSQEISVGSVNVELMELTSNIEILGTSKITNKQLSFIPTSSLIPATEYKLTVSFIPQSIGNEITWIFTTTKEKQITIISHAPQINQSNIPIESNIQALLSEPIEQYLSSFNFSLTLEGNDVKGELTANNNTITFAPATPLNYSTEYLVNISAEGELLNKIPPYQFSFTTESPVQRTKGSFHPEIQTYGKTQFSLVPIEKVKADEMVKISFGIPFPKDYLNDIEQFRILDESGTELDIAVKEILPWHNVHDKTSVRSALVQLELQFENNEYELLVSRQLTLEWGVSRKSNILPLEPVKDLWVLVDDGEYPAEDKISEPLAYAVFQPKWYGDSVIKTRLLPSGTHPDFSAHDSAFQLFGDTAINLVDPRVIDENLIPHRKSYAAWLFDRAMTIYQLAFKTGDFKYLRAAHRASQFYLQHINEQGYFSLKSYNDMKYSYGESLVANFILLGDPNIPTTIEKMISAWDSFNINYTLNTNFWTERHAAVKLLGYVTAYELTGAINYQEKAATTFLSLQAMQETPFEGVPKTGAIMHTAESHGEGGSYFIASPWMSAYLIDAIERYYIHFNDDSALHFIIKMADFFKQEDTSLYEWKGWKGEDSYYVSHYLAGTDLTAKEHGGDGSLDLEHTPDVSKIFSAAYFSSCTLTQCDDSYLSVIAKLYNSTVTYTFPYWIRTAAPSVGYSAYRLAPPRKFSWWFKTTANIDFLIGEDTPLPVYKTTAPKLELIQEHQATYYQPEEKITFSYKLINNSNVAAKNIIIAANTIKYSPENLLNIVEMSPEAINRSGAVVWKIEEIAPGETITDLFFSVSVNQFPTLPTIERPLGSIVSFADLHYCHENDAEDVCPFWQNNWDIGVQPYKIQSNWQVIPPLPPSTPPTINIVTPIMHDSISGLTDLITEINDQDGVVKVEFWLNNEIINTFNQPPYNSSIQSNALASGEHIFTVKAWDIFGSYKESSVTVSTKTPDIQPPTVEIQSPVSGREYCNDADITYLIEDNYSINSCVIDINSNQIIRPNCGSYKVFKTIPLFKSQAHLTFDQSENPLISLDGNNLIGTGNDINYALGHLNNSIYFDNDSSEVNFETTSLAINNDVTVSFWLKPETAEGMLLSQDWGYIGNEKGWAIYLGANNHRNNNTLSISWSSGNNINNANDTNIVQSPANSIALAQWQHIAVRKKGANVDIFINGDLSISQTISYPGIGWPFTSAKQLSIAKATNHPNLYNKEFHGALDELAIWNQALLNEEISQLYNSTDVFSQQKLTINAVDNAGNIGSSSVDFILKSCE